MLSIVEWSVCQRPGLSKVCTTHCLYNSSATSERAFSTCTEKAFTYLRSSMTEQRLWVTVQLCTSTRIFLTKWTWTWLFKPLQQQMRKWDDILAPFSFWLACIELLHGFFSLSWTHMPCLHIAFLCHNNIFITFPTCMHAAKIAQQRNFPKRGKSILWIINYNQQISAGWKGAHYLSLSSRHAMGIIGLFRKRIMPE